MRTNLKTATAICAALAAAAFAGAASAQTVEEFTVYGSRDSNELSAAVSYADLDLRNETDQKTLKMRVKDTATTLCDKLGEANTTSMGPVPSCVDAAMRRADADMKKAIEMAPNKVAMAPAPMPVETMAEPAPTGATADTSAAPAATFTNQTVTNGPVPDTADNRARFGGPMSRAGKRTAATGN